MSERNGHITASVASQSWQAQNYDLYQIRSLGYPPLTADAIDFGLEIKGGSAVVKSFEYKCQV